MLKFHMHENSDGIVAFVAKYLSRHLLVQWFPFCILINLHRFEYRINKTLLAFTGDKGCVSLGKIIIDGI